MDGPRLDRVACAADGVCQFPNYMECPIKPGIFNPDSGRRWDNKEHLLPLTRTVIQSLWEETDFEAVPRERH